MILMMASSATSSAFANYDTRDSTELMARSHHNRADGGGGGRPQGLESSYTTSSRHARNAGGEGKKEEEEEERHHQQQPRSLIINGEPVADAESRYPYFALMVSYHTPDDSCGGTLVHADMVLTSAHCLGLARNADGTLPILKQENGTALIAGNLRVFIAPEEHPDGDTIDDGVGIVGTIVHPDYDTKVSRTDNDLALLHLEEIVTDHEPVRLNRDTSLPEVSQQVKVIGYGAISTSPPRFPDELNEVDLEVVDTQQCETIYTTIHEADRDICALGGEAISNGMIIPKDACFGDSGGPLLIVGEVNDDGTMPPGDDIQVGVVAHGPEEIDGLDVANTVPCGNTAYPGVYVRISAYVDWIDEVICELSSNPPSSCNESLLPPTTASPTTETTTTNSPSSSGSFVSLRWVVTIGVVASLVGLLSAV
eukprot:CAMPEP_0194029356 /NCGR_PEP_ID=MMETSP0009_2-20130614/3092_1 /TAXON_ID=210454 /ORGANISM="Grammatophora oceanica, Strain CCMP 410" /LENGTH=423 /DNA_ID=CAMNT_0038668987 /DNA_START=402 /DNA_END=1673 /DNA_ORIENTATION=-